jgi:hypothetical protein
MHALAAYEYIGFVPLDNGQDAVQLRPPVYAQNPVPNPGVCAKSGERVPAARRAIPAELREARDSALLDQSPQVLLIESPVRNQEVHPVTERRQLLRVMAISQAGAVWKVRRAEAVQQPDNIVAAGNGRAGSSMVMASRSMRLKLVH